MYITLKDVPLPCKHNRKVSCCHTVGIFLLITLKPCVQTFFDPLQFGVSCV